MGGSSSREKALQRIIKSNRNDLNEQDLEEIMMNTQFNEFELSRLHEKFLKLDTRKRGKLTNREFLEIEELKCTPFRIRLKYAFPLKSDEEVKATEILRAETLKLDDYKDLDEILGKDHSNRGKEEVKNSQDNMVTGMDNAKKQMMDDEEEKKEDRKDPDEDFRDDRSSNKVAPKDYNGDEVDNEIDNEAFVQSLGTVAYIDFQEFCRLLAIFNPRYNLDEKVRFYFRIFDFNQDKKVTDDDLIKIINIMFVGTEDDANYAFPEEDKKHLVDKLMQEADTGQKEYLDVDDIEKILWATNIEQKCSMTFFQD